MECCGADARRRIGVIRRVAPVQPTQGCPFEAVQAGRRGAVRPSRDPERRRGRRRDRRDRGGREAAAGGDRDLHDLRVLDRGRRNVVGQHVPRRRSRRALQSLQLSRSSRTTGRVPTPASPNCSRTSRKPSTSSACAPICSWGSPSGRPPGTTIATSGRSRSTRGPSKSAMYSSVRSASSTSPGIPLGRGWRNSRGRSSTPPGGSISTTCPTRSSPSSARGRPRPRSCRPYSPS